MPVSLKGFWSMKFAKIAAFAAAVLLAVTLYACGEHGQGHVTGGGTDDPTGSSTKVTDGVTDTDTVKVTEKTDMNEVITLTSGESELKISGSETGIRIISLKNGNGNNALPAENDYPLPKGIAGENPEWRFYSAAKITAGGADGAVFTYRDPDGKYEAELTVTAEKNTEGPFEFTLTLKNMTSETVRLTPGSFSALKFNIGQNVNCFAVKKESGAAEGYKHSDGFRTAGSGIYTTDTSVKKSGNIWLNTDQDWNKNGWLPLAFMQGDGECVYCGLEWSSGRILWDRAGNDITLSVDMDRIASQYATTDEFATKLGAGNTFEFPTVYYGIGKGDTDAVSNTFRRWYFNVKVPSNLRENPNEPFTQIGSMNDVDLISIESTKWDYGWWSADKLKEGTDWRSLEGAWADSTVRHPSLLNLMSAAGATSLKSYATKLKARGINFTVYLLLHDTLDASGNPTGEYGEFNSVKHPDWFSNRLVTTAMGHSADLGNAACVEYLKTSLTDFFGGNLIPTWRTDFEPICRSSDKENRHYKNGSDVMYWCTKGFDEVITHLIENVPGFRYESCSSGGSMKDLYTGTVATVINCDDSANWLSLRTTFYDSSYVIHPAQLQIPVNINSFNTDSPMFWPEMSTSYSGDGYNFHDAIIDMGFRSAILGPPMFATFGGGLMREKVAEYSMLYREKVRPIQKSGELYHILTRPDGVNWDGVMYADPDTSADIKGIVFLFKPSDKAGNVKNVVLRGLDPQKSYKLSFEDNTGADCVKTGESLMTDGINVTVMGIGSEIIWITEAE